jgi:hypothetical protein
VSGEKSSVQQLFMQLGERPSTRSARADSVFRRLRETDEDKIRALFTRSTKLQESRLNPFRRSE